MVRKTLTGRTEPEGRSRGQIVNMLESVSDGPKEKLQNGAFESRSVTHRGRVERSLSVAEEFTLHSHIISDEHISHVTLTYH